MGNNQSNLVCRTGIDYNQSEEDINECIDVLAVNLERVKEDINAPKILVKLCNLAGDFDKAIDTKTIIISEHGNWGKTFIISMWIHIG